MDPLDETLYLNNFDNVRSIKREYHMLKELVENNKISSNDIILQKYKLLQRFFN